MSKTSFRFGFLVILLLLGMMIGITMAEKGIYNVVGTPDSNSKSFQVTQNDNQLEIMVFGETYNSGITTNPNPSNIEEEQRVEPEEQRLEPEEQTLKPKEPNINNVGILGNKIGEALQIGTEKGLSILAKLID
ncbi:MAG: DUF3679 domain-containing protein [Vulcanibacillus sp.]